MSKYFCRICEHTLDTIPDGTIPIGRRHGRYQMARFPDGAVHDLMRLIDPPAPEPATELLTTTIQVLADLPTPEPIDPQPLQGDPVEPEQEPELETTMAYAFRNIKKL